MGSQAHKRNFEPLSSSSIGSITDQSRGSYSTYSAARCPLRLCFYPFSPFHLESHWTNFLPFGYLRNAFGTCFHLFHLTFHQAFIFPFLLRRKHHRHAPGWVSGALNWTYSCASPVKQRINSWHRSDSCKQTSRILLLYLMYVSSI